MSKITYANKVALNVNSDIADINKVNASDLNEIKEVVNTNDDNTTNNSNAIGTLSNLNTTEKSNLVNAINEVNQNDINKSTYSNTEKIIGKWIDGKPLYRRTFKGVTSSGEYTTLTADYNSNTIRVTKVYGGIQGDYGTQVGCYVNNNYYSGLFIHIDELQLYCGNSLKGKEYNVTIEFTKTTD